MKCNITSLWYFVTRLFSLNNVFKCHWCCTCISTLFLFLPNNTPLYVHTAFFNLFIWLFPLLTIINSTVMNILIKVFCGCMLSFLLGMCLGVKLLDHVVILCSYFLRSCSTVFQGTGPFTFLPTICEGSSFFPSLTLSTICLFNSSRPLWISISLWLWFAFP